MKKNGALKMTILIISILLIALISFVGIYKQQGGSMENILPDYNLGKELSGSRLISFVVDNSTEEVEVATENETEEPTTEKVPVNKPEVLTAENYETAKNIIKSRLNDFGIANYDIRVNQINGTIALEVGENLQIDDIIIYLMSQGKFEIIDAETEEILLDNSNIKEAKTMYYTSTTGTSVYLDIVFDDEGKTKLEEISKTYIETEDDEGNKTKKTVSIKIDDETITTTYFGQTISNGELPLTIGSETTDTATLNEYFLQSEQIVTLLTNGVNPILYTVNTNEYVSPVIDETIIKNIIIIAIAVLVLMELYFIIRYRMTGLIAAISMIGYVALYLLVLRFTDTILLLEAMAAVGIAVLVQFMFLHGIANKLKDGVANRDVAVKEELIKNIQVQIPLYIMAIVFVFANWETLMSFGTALFWGLIISVIYNFIFTRVMFIQKENKKK